MPFLPYLELIKKNNNSALTYGEKLYSLEWRNIREAVIKRDKTTCRKCGIIAFIEGDNNFYLTKIPDEEFQEMVKRNKEEFEKTKDHNFFSEDESYPEIFNENIRKSNSKYKRTYDNNLVPERVIEIHVHHTYYVNNLLPWEYPLKDLVTLCKSCHEKIHATETIYIYSDLNFSQKIALSNCKRCNGTGFFEEYQHVQNGICFGCKGTGYEGINDFSNILI